MRWRTRQPPVVRLRCRCRRFLCHAQHLIVDGFCQPRGVSSGRTNTTLYSRLYQNSMTARITAWPMISSDLIRSTFGTKPIMSGSPYRRASANDGSARRPSRRPRPRRCSRNPPLPKPERCPRGAYRIAPGLRSSRNGWVAVQSSRTYPSVPVTRFPDLRAPFGSHASAGMDVDVPSPSGAGVDELVRRAGRGDYDLPARRLDGGVSYREGKLALLHHEDLLVRVSVQLWALSGRRLRQEERDIHVAVEETLKPVYGPVVRKFVVADYVGHSDHLSTHRLRPGPARVPLTVAPCRSRMVSPFRFARLLQATIAMSPRYGQLPVVALPRSATHSAGTRPGRPSRRIGLAGR